MELTKKDKETLKEFLDNLDAHTSTKIGDLINNINEVYELGYCTKGLSVLKSNKIPSETTIDMECNLNYLLMIWAKSDSKRRRRPLIPLIYKAYKQLIIELEKSIDKWK